MNKQAFMKKAKIDWEHVARKYGPTAVGAGIGVGAVGVHDIMQTPEEDAKETLLSKALKYSLGGIGGGLSGYHLGYFTGISDPAKMSEQYRAKKRGEKIETLSPAAALAKQYGSTQAYQQSLEDAKKYRLATGVNVTQQLSDERLNEEIPIFRDAREKGLLGKRTMGQFDPKIRANITSKILSESPEILLSDRSGQEATLAHELRHAMQRPAVGERILNVKKSRRAGGKEWADLLKQQPKPTPFIPRSGKDIRDKLFESHFAYAIQDPGEREVRLAAIKTQAAREGKRITNADEAYKFLLDFVNQDKEQLLKGGSETDLAIGYRYLQTPELKEKYLRWLAKQLPALVNIDNNFRFRKTADMNKNPFMAGYGYKEASNKVQLMNKNAFMAGYLGLLTTKTFSTQGTLHSTL